MDESDGPSSETAAPVASASSASTSFTTPSRERMFRKIIYSPNAFFKAQQKDEADLMETEKHSFCSKLFAEHPVQFLARYHQYLDSEDVPCFQEPLSSIDNEDVRYELNYYLQEMAKRKTRAKSDDHPDSVAKNRRYAALRRLIANGDYFSDYEMRERDPLLYDQMIGQYQTESEQKSAFHSGDRQATTLSSVLLDMYDAKELSKRRHAQMVQHIVSSRSSGRKMENESDEEEMEDDDNEQGDSLGYAASREQPESISNAEKQDLREDFIREMQERFLDGRDTNFDYRTVDENPEYDLVDMQARDDEDRYFDEEEPVELEEQADQKSDDGIDSMRD